MNKNVVWAYRIAICWFFVFSLNALATAILAASIGTMWADLHYQDRFEIVLAIIVNYTGTMMAFMSKAAKKVEDGGSIVDLAVSGSSNGGTQMITKTDIQSTTIQQKSPSTPPTATTTPIIESK